MCIKIISSQSSTVQSLHNTTYKHTNRYFTVNSIFKIINTITECKFTPSNLHKVKSNRTIISKTVDIQNSFNNYFCYTTKHTSSTTLQYHSLFNR